MGKRGVFMGRSIEESEEKPATGLTPGMPTKPPGLSKGAARQWDRLVDEMQRSNITLIPAYRAAIVQAATIMADLATAWEHVKAHGRYTVSKTGVEKISPAVEDTAKLNEKQSRCLWQLGITPRARPVAASSPADKTFHGKDPLDAYLDGDIDAATAEAMAK
jgi:P27 family predicted phage terminase small subunit